MKWHYDDFTGFPSKKGKVTRGLNRFLRKSRRSVSRISHHTTDSDAASIASTPALPSTRFAEDPSESNVSIISTPAPVPTSPTKDHNDSNGDIPGYTNVEVNEMSFRIVESDDSDGSDRAKHPRPRKTPPFQIMNLLNHFKDRNQSSNTSLNASGKQGEDSFTKLPKSARSLASNGKDASTRSQKQRRRSTKSISRKGRSNKSMGGEFDSNEFSERSDRSYVLDGNYFCSPSHNLRNRKSRSKKSVTGKDGSDSDSLGSLDLSFAILQNSCDLNASGIMEPNALIDLEVGEQNIGLLAVSRTPSFNVMLHANKNYSDCCTLVKCKSVRITWEDLANNTKEQMEEMMAEEEEAQDAVGDLRGSGMRSLTSKKTSEIFGVRNMRARGSFLVRRPSKRRSGSNLGGVPLWSGTSTITINSDFSSFIVSEKIKDWLKSFKTCDPRYRILNFFNDVANEGATGDSENFVRDHVSPLLKYFNRASVFTVWRPTSLQSIRRMMLGEGVGKGLDIKGKSAKRGKLSAFVPFMQIYKDEHKAKVKTLQKNGTIRIFFNSKEDRDIVISNLDEIAIEIMENVRHAKEIVKEKEKYDDETVENALKQLVLDMGDTAISIIDTYVDTKKFGIEVQERLFWEGMVMRQNIYRKPASADDIGRSSMPSFQDMNFESLRKPYNDITGGHTRAVILQYNPPGEENTNPMSPLNLLMAYEENDPNLDRRRVIPVVSDFDCFIVGTRGVKYSEEVPEDQIDVLRWMVKQTETILDSQDSNSWTKRWLDVLKDSGNKGFYPKTPPMGYADPKTKLIFKHAINRLSITGAVRHGAECFNYSFPQELDDELLVISDDLPDGYSGCNWVYVDQEELKEILMFKIQRGYTFPLNPKWVLCDPGWKEVYDKVIASVMPNVQDSMRCFYPPKSGIRDLIESIYKKHPEGFQRFDGRIERMRHEFRTHGRSERLSNIDSTYAQDLALYKLKNYLTLQRAKKKIRGYIQMNSILKSIRRNSEVVVAVTNQKQAIIQEDGLENISELKPEIKNDDEQKEEKKIYEDKTSNEHNQDFKQKGTVNGVDGF